MYITVWFPNNMNILDCVVHITIQSKLKMSKNRFKIEGEYDRCLVMFSSTPTNELYIVPMRGGTAYVTAKATFYLKGLF